MSLQAIAFGTADAARRTRPLARTLVAALFLAIVLLMFAVSSGVLWNLGINYSGVTGAAASKIHPATYLGFATLGLLILARRNPASFFVTLVTRHPGTLAFLLATLLVGGTIVLDSRKGIATIFDTYLLAIVVALIAAELESRDFTRAEKLIHVLLAANALLGLAEYALNTKVFPFRFDGVALDWDARSNGLLGHPLENAQMTGLYIMVLLAGGGAAMPKALRPAAILLQLSALVPFGGRTALLLTLAMTALWLAPRMLGVLRGARLSLPAFAAIAVLAPMLALGVGMIAVGGFFDVITDRFADDGGSAKTRVEMFEIFNNLSAREIFIGASSDVIELAAHLARARARHREPGRAPAALPGRGVHRVPDRGLCIVHDRDREAAAARCRHGDNLLPRDHQFLREHRQQDGRTRAVRRAAAGDVPEAGETLAQLNQIPQERAARSPSAAEIAGSKLRDQSSTASPMPSNRFQNAHGIPPASQTSRTSRM